MENNKPYIQESMIEDLRIKLNEISFDYLHGFINQFGEEISDDDWSVSQFLRWLQLNNFKIVKEDITDRDLMS